MTLLIPTPQTLVDHDLSTRPTAAPSTSPNILRNQSFPNWFPDQQQASTKTQSRPARIETSPDQAANRIPPYAMWTQLDQPNFHRKFAENFCSTTAQVLPLPGAGAPFMQSHCSVSSHEWAIAQSAIRFPHPALLPRHPERSRSQHHRDLHSRRTPKKPVQPKPFNPFSRSAPFTAACPTSKFGCPIHAVSLFSLIA